MNIVILHCHFERGGVTQVVENHVRAVVRGGDDKPPLLFSGPRQSGLSPATLANTRQAAIKDFDYDPPDLPVGKAEERAEAITARVVDCLGRFGFTPDDTVLHWHNHSLGKNTAAPSVIRRLACSGWRMLLQIHDYAEDNRPSNYAALIRAIGATSPEQVDQYLYPIAPQIHYATLTRADAGVLASLGVSESRTHCLPNSVVPVAAESLDSDDSLDLVRRSFGLAETARWCLYPVRGIRRKNLGEFLMLCRWLPDGMHAGMTLRPTTPVEAQSYDRWKSLAAKVSPNAVFDAAHHPDVTYADNLSACDFVLSTSVAEGFGMAFLEPWLAARGVVAREIATVMNDFLASGMQFEATYDRISVPGSPQWLKAAREQYLAASEDAWRQVPQRFRPSAASAQSASETIDFAELTPQLQSQVLERASTDSGFENELQQLSSGLVKRLRTPLPPAQIQHNAALVADVYSSDRQGEVLRSLYRSILSSDVTEVSDLPPSESTAIELISQVRPFYPCRTEAFPTDE